MTESFVENKNFKEIKGYYGFGHTPCVIFVYINERRGYAYYCVERGMNLNKTTEVDKLVTGVDIEELSDIDSSTLQSECTNLWQFKRRILA